MYSLTGILAAWVALLGLATPQGATIQLPFVVDRAWVGPAKVKGSPGIVYIQVHNLTTRTLLSWGVSAEIRNPDGVIERRRLFVDNAVTAPDSRLTALKPSATLVYRTGYTAAEGSDVAATAAMAVFDDDVAVGDEGMIADDFVTRGRHQRFWALVSNTLNELVEQRVDPRIALQTLDSRLLETPDRDIRTMSHTAVLRQRIASDTLQRNRQAPSDVLRDLISQASALKAELDAHATRK